MTEIGRRFSYFKPSFERVDENEGFTELAIAEYAEKLRETFGHEHH